MASHNSTQRRLDRIIGGTASISLDTEMISFHSKSTSVLIATLLSAILYGKVEANRPSFGRIEQQASPLSTGHEPFAVKSSLVFRSDAMNILTQRSYFKSRTDEVSKQDKEPLMDTLVSSSTSSSSATTSTTTTTTAAATTVSRTALHALNSRHTLFNSVLDGVLDDDNSDDYLYRKRPLSTSTNPSLIHSLDIDIPRGGGSSSIGDTSKLKPLSAAAVHGPILSLLYKLSGWIAESSSRCWTTLMLSIFVEIAATTMTKQASDSGSAGRMTLAMGMYVTSLLGFAASLPKIDVSVAYAVWSALGTAFVSAAGILLFGEKCDRLKIASILMIVAGVVGLNMSEDGGHH